MCILCATLARCLALRNDGKQFGRVLGVVKVGGNGVGTNFERREMKALAGKLAGKEIEKARERRHGDAHEKRIGVS
uniref:G-patch domain-containing protein n=1 Tax=Globodera pallida TaxID=36090 RepID=A0A183C3Z0_GLOPA